MEGIGKDENGNFFMYFNDDKKLIPHTCPVCRGKGIVPNGFYLSTTGQFSSTSTSPETCRSCHGQGYILV